MSGASAGSRCVPVVLSAEDLEGGFLGEPPDGPANGVVIETVLAVGGSGPMLTGRKIAFAYALPGGRGITTSEGGLVVVEAVMAQEPGSAACAGSVRVALPAAGTFKGRAWFEADLGPLRIREAGIECTAIVGAAVGGAAGVECPLVGIRDGESATSGTLWLRITGVGHPEVVDRLPAWLAAVAGGVPGESQPRPPGVSGSVTLGEQEPWSIVDGGSVALRTALGRVGYVASLPFDAAGGRLEIGIPDYDKPGRWAGFARLELEQQYQDGPHIAWHNGPCEVDVAAGGRTGRATCELTHLYDEPLETALALEADWTADEIEDQVGERIVVAWKLGGGIVSEGRAVVARSLEPGADPGIFLLPDVPLEARSPSAVLRLRILGHTGDGSYSGTSVDPAIDILTDSPLLAIAVSDLPEAQPWTPVLGSCTATVSDDGARGTMSCPGNPGFPPDQLGGSVTLTASWAPG